MNVNYIKNINYSKVIKAERIEQIGEQFVYSAILPIFGAEYIFRNISLTQSDGGTAEIDLLAVCQSGIFVFESKNYRGCVCGGSEQKNWTQFLPNKNNKKSRRKFKFCNPVQQNAARVAAIRHNLPQYSKTKCCSFVVFSNQCVLNDIICNRDDVRVLNVCNLKNSINEQIRTDGHILDSVDIAVMSRFFSEMQESGEQARERHLAEIIECPERYADKDEPVPVRKPNVDNTETNRNISVQRRVKKRRVFMPLLIVIAALLITAAVVFTVKNNFSSRTLKLPYILSSVTTSETTDAQSANSVLYSREYRPIISKYAAEYSIDERLIDAIIQSESGFNSDYQSDAGGRGLMSITEDIFTAVQRKMQIKSVTFDSMYEPDKNIKFGSYYISYLRNIFGNDTCAVAAYHAGVKEVRKWLKDGRYSDDGKKLKNIPSDDTKRFVNKIIQTYNSYKQSGSS